ncbi:MAG: hypothetical protein JO041_00385 [Acidobacteria bacterium]|nr:hypothetical protein [Acidobacteriota bacterium]
MSFRAAVYILMPLLAAVLSRPEQAKAPAPAAQNPSPMTDTTRAHKRVPQTELAGKRYQLTLGGLFVPAGMRLQHQVPLVVHFHGAAWLAERSALLGRGKSVVLVVNLGAGSGVYRQAFENPNRFSQLLDEAARALNPDQPPIFHPLMVSSFSAGYGAVRQLLSDSATRNRIDDVVLADGLHTSYVPDGAPGPLDPAPLAPFLDFAHEAIAGHKCMIITHSEIFPGTFASTTETADYLLNALGLQRHAVVRWGPMGMQQLSEVNSGRFHLLGFAGNSAPDHIDHFHALENWLRRCR